MKNLEFKYLQIIKEIKNLEETKEKNIFIKPMIWFYKMLIKKRHTKLVKQFEKNGGDKKAFVVWNNLLLKAI